MNATAPRSWNAGLAGPGRSGAGLLERRLSPGVGRDRPAPWVDEGLSPVIQVRGQPGVVDLMKIRSLGRRVRPGRRHPSVRDRPVILVLGQIREGRPRLDEAIPERHEHCQDEGRSQHLQGGMSVGRRPVRRRPDERGRDPSDLGSSCPTGVGRTSSGVIPAFGVLRGHAARAGDQVPLQRVLADGAPGSGSQPENQLGRPRLPGVTVQREPPDPPPGMIRRHGRPSFS